MPLLQRQSVIKLGSLFALLSAAPAGRAIAQPGAPARDPDAFLNQQRLIEESINAERKKLAVPTDKFELDYGGFYSFHLFLFDDGVESSRTFRRHDLRLWGRLALDQGAHQIYVRSRLSFVDFNAGDAYDGNEDDIEGMNLERGFYQFDLTRALQAYADKRIDYNIELKIGRDLTEIGTGLVLSTPLDLVRLRATWRHIELTGFAGRTVGSSQDFDLSRPTTRTRRAMFGVQAKYLGFERHEPFAYVLWQRDRNHETLPRPFQEFDYDSFYAGFGSTGELVTNLRYSTEWVVERGHNVGDGQFFKRNSIEAWAWDIELEYLFDTKGKPRVAMEYMFASGDPDRPFSPTDTVDGLLRGHVDSSFVGFGYRNTGLSFAPRLSNIHIWRAGAAFFPFEQHEAWKRLEVGSDWFLYHKHHASAAVSDPTADVPSGYAGWEMDYFANWDITSDLSATARYGVFFPGAAYSDRTTRTFLLVGVTWSF